MKKILYILLLLVSKIALGQDPAPSNVVQLTTNTPYYQTTTGLHWYYNGTTYLWYKGLGVKDSTYYITPYYANTHYAPIGGGGSFILNGTSATNQNFNLGTGVGKAASIIATDGTSGLNLRVDGVAGAGIWSTTVTPDNSNYALVTSGANTRINGGTTLNFGVDGSSNMLLSNSLGLVIGYSTKFSTAPTVNDMPLRWQDTTRYRSFANSMSLAQLASNYQPLITAGTTLQYYRGDKTFQTLNTAVVPELTNLYYTNARGIGSTLTGYTSGAGTISASDNILQAIQKLNGNTAAISASAITALTGDATATGPGSVALTLATVNSNIGSFGTASSVPTITFNGKGLATSVANTSIQIAESQVTSLVADLALKAPLASPALTGTPTTPTPGSNINTTQIVNGAWVNTYYQPLNAKLTSISALANASGVLTNNGSGVFSYTTPSTGTVSTVSVVTANGVSGSVANATTTPAITLSLGAITPTSTNGVSATTMAFNDATSSIQTQLNSKQATGNYITALTGEAMASGPGSSTVTLANSAVIGKVLTGYTSGAGTVASTDNILQAIQKLNGNAALTSAIITNSHTAYVDTLGNDGTGIVNRPDKPFLTVNAALAALPTTSFGIVKVGAGTFNSPSHSSLRANIWIQGSGMPNTNWVVSTDTTQVITVSAPTKLVGGTIFNGTFDPNGYKNVMFSDFGVDVGSVWCTASNGGVAAEGFIYNAADYTRTHAPLPGFVAYNISALCKANNSAVHAFLVENAYYPYINNIHTYFGEAGTVLKVTGGIADNIFAYGHSSYGLIIKANHQIHADHLLVSNVTVGSIGTYDGGGITIAAQNGQNMSDVTVTGTKVYGTTYGMLVYTDQTIDQLNINNFTFWKLSGKGFESVGNLNNSKISIGVIRDATGIGFDFENSITSQVDNVSVYNSGSENFKLGSAGTLRVTGLYSQVNVPGVTLGINYVDAGVIITNVTNTGTTTNYGVTDNVVIKKAIPQVDLASITTGKSWLVTNYGPDGNFYIAQTDLGNVFTLNKTTGKATLVGNLGIAIPVYSSGTFAPAVYNSTNAQFEAGTTSGSGSTFALTNSPIFVTPNLGTPSSLTLTSATGLPNAGLVNSTISGISLGSNLANLTATNSSLTFSGTYNGSTARTIGLNMANANTWSATQTFATIVASGNISLSATSSASTYGISRNSSTQLQFNGGASGYVFNDFANGANLVAISNVGVVRLYNLSSAGIVANDASGNLSTTTALPSGTTAATPSGSTDVANKAYVDASKIIAGSFSGVGAATTTFTVTIGTTMANTTYKVTASPTNVLSAAVFYITNKTTTTFDVVYLTGLTGTITFDWHVAP